MRFWSERIRGTRQGQHVLDERNSCHLIHVIASGHQPRVPHPASSPAHRATRTPCGRQTQTVRTSEHQPEPLAVSDVTMLMMRQPLATRLLLIVRRQLVRAPPADVCRAGLLLPSVNSDGVRDTRSDRSAEERRGTPSECDAASPTTRATDAYQPV